MANNLRYDDSIAQAAVRLDRLLAEASSPNAGTFLEKLLGDGVWDDIAAQVDEAKRIRTLNHVEDRLRGFGGAGGFLNGSKEARQAEWLIANGYAVRINPLEGAPIGSRARGDAFVNGSETDFKELARTSDLKAIENNVNAWFKNDGGLQGTALLIDARAVSPSAAASMNPASVLGAVETGLDFVRGSASFSGRLSLAEQIQVILPDGSSIIVSSF